MAYIVTLVRTEESKTGRLISDLANHLPYAEIIGHKVPTTLALPAPQQVEIRRKIGRPKGSTNKAKMALSNQQKTVLAAITAGHHSPEGILKVTGMGTLGGMKRAARNLVKKKYITYSKGEYHLISE